MKYAIRKNIKYTMNTVETYFNEVVLGKYVLKIVLYETINMIVAITTVSPA